MPRITRSTPLNFTLAYGPVNASVITDKADNVTIMVRMPRKELSRIHDTVVRVAAPLLAALQKNPAGGNPGPMAFTKPQEGTLKKRMQQTIVHTKRGAGKRRLTSYAAAAVKGKGP